MEKFSLKWNDFHSNVSKSFGLFRSEEYLYDVRLMTEDYHEVSAHKLVLSACSEYFRNIFKKSNKQDTLICLDGVTNSDLKNVLDYIYLGELQIYQDKLDRFLAVAAKLKLEGLLNQEEEETKYAEIPNTQHSTIDDNKEKVSKKMDKPSSINTAEIEANVSPVKIVKLNDAMVHGELDSKIREFGEIVEGGRRCNLCHKLVPGKNATNFRNHVERYHMEGLSFDCPVCSKTFRSRGTLSMHRHTIKH